MWLVNKHTPPVDNIWLRKEPADWEGSVSGQRKPGRKHVQVSDAGRETSLGSVCTERSCLDGQARELTEPHRGLYEMACEHNTKNCLTSCLWCQSESRIARVTIDFFEDVDKELIQLAGVTRFRRRLVIGLETREFLFQKT